MKSFTITKKETLADSEILIEGELSIDSINLERKKALDLFQNRITLPGFRNGHIPEKILVEKVGELSIYEEAASIALEKNYSEIIKETEIKAIGNPRVSITKIAVGAPVGFKIETAVVPEIKLADYKKISQSLSSAILSDSEDTLVEDKEVDQALDDMRRSFAHHEAHHQEKSKDSKEAEESEIHIHDDHTGKDIPEDELPPLNDEFAKKLGNFENLIILKEKIKDSIYSEKKIRAKEKNRLKIIEEIIEKSDISVPVILIESEVNKMLAEFKGNLERMGIKYDQYLNQIKKGEEDIRNEWKTEAEKRAKIELVLRQISVEQKIEANNEEVEKEVNAILSQYKDAKKENVEMYVLNVLTNEKVWQFLETKM